MVTRQTFTSGISVDTTSAAPSDAFTLEDEKSVSVVFGKAGGKQCARSRRFFDDVGSNPAYPDLSARDAQAIALMSRDLIEAGLGRKSEPERIRRAMNDRDTVTLVACERSQLVGFAIMEFGDERAHLVLLAVRPSHRRHSVGRRLIEWLAESVATAGLASIHLELRTSNEAARAFYRAMGFSETVQVPGYYRGKEAATRMVRVLRVPGPLPFNWRPPTLDKK